MYKFKPQAKQNAKRFLVKTCKLENFEEFLCQDGDGQWGCYLDEAGKPVEHATVVTRIQAAAEETCAPADPEAVAADMAQAMEAINTQIDEALASSQVEEPAEAETVDHAEPAQEDPAEAPAPAAAAFGAFAVAQLTAAAPAPTEEAAKPRRDGATSTTGLKIERDREIRNGVQRQSKGSIGDTLWCMYDAIGPQCTLAQARAAAEAAGFNKTSGAISLYRWRRFNGYTGK